VVEVISENYIVSIYGVVRCKAESDAILILRLGVLGEVEIRGGCWRVGWQAAVILGLNFSRDTILDVINGQLGN